ncbi:MAG: PPC domain-containing DNA-binding protein [Candidatus Odinarchaeota archaeon]
MDFINSRCLFPDMTGVQVTKTTGRVVIARLKPGNDVLHSIEKIATENKIQSGQLSMIGAVSGVHLGYFDREEKVYKDFRIEEDLEIVSGIGNITKYDNNYVIHAHLVAADQTGRCYGGHLLEGCEVSVTIELIIIEIPELLRATDEATGLKLLNI